MAGPIQFVRGGSGRGALKSRYGPGRLAFEVDAKDIARIRRKMERIKGKPLAEQTRKVLYAQADIVGSRARSTAPRGPTGHLRASIKVRAELERGVLSAAYFALVGGSIRNGVLVGPLHKIAPHRHLIISGHRIVTPGGRFTGRRTAPNPFMDRARRGIESAAGKAVMAEWMRLWRTG